MSTSRPTSLLNGQTVKIDAGARKGDVYKYVGQTLAGTVDLAQQTYTDTSKWTDLGTGGAFDYTWVERPASLLNGKKVKVTAGANAGHVYLYIGSTIAGTVDLSGLDYSDTTVWEHVDLTAVASGVQAYTKDSSIFSTGVLTLTATGSQSIIATVLAGAAGVGGGGTTGVAVTAAGAFAQNDIASDVKAYIDGDRSGPSSQAGITAASITIGATDSSGVQAIVAAASIAASVGGTTGIAFSIGFSMALNQVANAVEAAIKNANPGVTTTSGGISITATVAGLPLFDTSDAGLTPGALDDASFADTDDPGTSANEATDDAPGDAATLALLATKFTGLYSLSSGWKLDVIRPGSVWQVTDGLLGFRTFIVTLDSVTGALHVSAPTIEAIVLAASVAASFGGTTGIAISGAGAIALNNVTSKANAHIDDSTVTSATGVSLDGDGHELDLRGRAGRLRRRRRRRQRRASAPRSASRSRSTRSARRSSGTSSPTEIQAYVLRSLDQRAGRQPDGDRDRRADDQRDRARRLRRRRRSAAAAGIAVSGAGVYTENRVSARVRAFVDGDGTTGISAAPPRFSAHDTSAIGAIAGAASIGAAFGGTAGVAVSVAVSLAHNSISNEVEAYVANADTSFTTTTGGITIDALENAGIRAVSAAARSRSARAALRRAESRAPAPRRGTRSTRRRTPGSSAPSSERTTVVDLDASDTSTIKALIAAVAIGVGAGTGGLGVGIGLSLAWNIVGTRATAPYGSNETLAERPAERHEGADRRRPRSGRRLPVRRLDDRHGVNLATQNYSDPNTWQLVGRASGAQAFIVDSSVTALGALTADATAHQTIDALVLAGAVALAAGGGAVAVGRRRGEHGQRDRGTGRRLHRRRRRDRDLRRERRAHRTGHLRDPCAHRRRLDRSLDRRHGVGLRRDRHRARLEHDRQRRRGVHLARRLGSNRAHDDRRDLDLRHRERDDRRVDGGGLARDRGRQRRASPSPAPAPRRPTSSSPGRTRTSTPAPSRAAAPSRCTRPTRRRSRRACSPSQPPSAWAARVSASRSAPPSRATSSAGIRPSARPATTTRPQPSRRSAPARRCTSSAAR